MQNYMAWPQVAWKHQVEEFTSRTKVEDQFAQNGYPTELLGVECCDNVEKAPWTGQDLALDEVVIDSRIVVCGRERLV